MRQHQTNFLREIEIHETEHMLKVKMIIFNTFMSFGLIAAVKITNS